MDFLKDCWELGLQQWYLFDLLALFYQHPELLENEYYKKAFESLKTEFIRQSGGQNPAIMARRKVVPHPLSREQELLELLDRLCALEQARQAFNESV